MRLITYLCDRGYLEKNESFQNFSLLPAAERVLFGGEKVIMLYRKEREKTQKEKKSKNALSLSEFHEAKTKNPSLDEKERSLYQKLVSLRTEIASMEHVPAYIVFSNATLIDMAKKRPTDSEAFLEISGVGRIKAMRYGEQFLSLIRKELTDGSH